MTDTTTAQQLVGSDVLGTDGGRIGRVETIYLDAETGTPEWLAVATGLFGLRHSFVPIAQATPGQGGVTVPYTRDQIKDAPTVDPDGGALSQDEEARLYAHYGLSYSEVTSDSGLPAGGNTRDQNLRSDDAMTRSEEQLRVGTTTETAGRVRLRKWVDTETVTQRVPVAHDEVRIEREPINSSNIDDALAGPEIRESEHEIVLTEERAVAETEVVPVERVRMETERVVEEETVAADLRKERIEVETEGDVERRPGL